MLPTPVSFMFERSTTAHQVLKHSTVNASMEAKCLAELKQILKSVMSNLDVSQNLDRLQFLLQILEMDFSNAWPSIS